MPFEMLEHLHNGGGNLDYMDVTHLMTELTKPWEITKNPTTKIVHDNKIECQLIKARLAAQPSLRLALAICAFKETGEYDKQICEFEAKAPTNKTLDKFQPFIINEYVK